MKLGLTRIKKLYSWITSKNNKKYIVIDYILMIVVHIILTYSLHIIILNPDISSSTT